MSTKSVQQQIEWRRNKVIELKSRGLSQVEIANQLQVSKQLISSDVQYLREQAKEQIKKYVTDHLPDNDGALDKESTSYDDIFDAFRLALKFYRFEDSSNN